MYRTIEEKIEIVKYAEQYSIHKASEKYDVDRQNIRTWRNQLPNLIAMTKKIFKNDYTFWEKPEIEDIDDDVVEWILMNIKIGIAVTS